MMARINQNNTGEGLKCVGVIKNFLSNITHDTSGKIERKKNKQTSISRAYTKKNKNKIMYCNNNSSY